MVAGSILITGANRGLGLQFVKQLLATATGTTHIFATYRDETRSGDLFELAANSTKVHTVYMDVTDDQTIIAAVEKVGQIVGPAGLNLLINNAGVTGGKRFTTLEEIERDDLMKTFSINSISPCMVAKHFAGLLRRAAKTANASKTSMGVDKAAIVQLGSRVGSVALTAQNPTRMSRYYAYRPSKCALNMLNQNLANELGEAGILCVCVHPGWVRTDMGGPDGDISTEESVGDMLKTLSLLTEKDQGAFVNQTGEVLPY